MSTNASEGRFPKNEQRAQEAEYAFPYHYLPSYRPNFSLHRSFGWGINYVATIEFMLAELESLAFSTVVDVGCGDGRFAREMALKFPGRSVLGVDYSPRAIALARAMNPDVANLAFLAADVAKAPPVTGADVAVLMEVLEHIPPTECARFLAGVSATLRPGGRLLLTVPSSNVPVTPKHFRHFSDALLRQVLEPCFVIEALEPFEKISFRRKLVAKLLSNGYLSLTHKGACNALYRYYKRTLFKADGPADGQRWYIKASRR